MVVERAKNAINEKEKSAFISLVQPVGDFVNIRASPRYGSRLRSSVAWSVSGQYHNLSGLEHRYRSVTQMTTIEL